MKVHPWLFVSLPALVIVACALTTARADDGAVKAVGGTVTAMKEHPTIHMTAEYVHARFENDGVHVECVFILENRGPATTVAIGFPNESLGSGINHCFPFSAFASYVDGESTGVTILPDAKIQSYEMGYLCWYVKEVEFAARQKRCIRDVYTGRGGSGYPNLYWFSYALWSGGTWAGPIETADIVFSFGPDSNWTDGIEISPPGFQRSSDEICWHFTNLEPGVHMREVRVAWEPPLPSEPRKE